MKKKFYWYEGKSEKKIYKTPVVAATALNNWSTMWMRADKKKLFPVYIDVAFFLKLLFPHDVAECSSCDVMSIEFLGAVVGTDEEIFPSLSRFEKRRKKEPF